MIENTSAAVAAQVTVTKTLVENENLKNRALLWGTIIIVFKRLGIPPPRQRDRDATVSHRRRPMIILPTNRVVKSR